MDDESYTKNSDIVEGMQFSATLQLRTPLDILQKHGEIFQGPPSSTPKYGTMSDGIWTVKVKMSGGESEHTHASDIGPVKPSYYLPFLIEFRKIVESAQPHDQILSQLKELSTKSSQFKAIWEKLSASREDFPSSFFYRDFTVLPGVGRKLAKTLYQSGFTSVEQIQNSSADALARIDGLGKSTAENISKMGVAP